MWCQKLFLGDIKLCLVIESNARFHFGKSFSIEFYILNRCFLSFRAYLVNSAGFLCLPSLNSFNETWYHSLNKKSDPLCSIKNPCAFLRLNFFYFIWMLSIASKIIGRHFWNLYDYLKSALLNDGNTHQSNDSYSRSNWSSRGSKTTKQEKKSSKRRRELTENSTRSFWPGTCCRREGSNLATAPSLPQSDITSPSFYTQVFTLKTTNTLVSNM